METTMTLSRKERRKAQLASGTLPAVISEAPESTENVGAVEPQEAPKTAPAGLLPTVPVAVTTRSSPTSMIPVRTVREGVAIWTEAELEDVEIIDVSQVRSIEDIMLQEGKSKNEATLIQQDELAAVEEAEQKAQKEASEATRILREVKEAEQAEADRLAKLAEEKAIIKRGEARVHYKQAKRHMLISLTFALASTAAFVLVFLTGGL
jgi:hypothetical protein